MDSEITEAPYVPLSNLQTQPEIMMLQILQLLVQWRNPTSLAWREDVKDIQQKCPLQNLELERLMNECERTLPQSFTDRELSGALDRELKRIIQQLSDTFPKGSKDKFSNPSQNEVFYTQSSPMEQIKYSRNTETNKAAEVLHELQNNLEKVRLKNSELELQSVEDKNTIKKLQNTVESLQNRNMEVETRLEIRLIQEIKLMKEIQSQKEEIEEMRRQIQNYTELSELLLHNLQNSNNADEVMSEYIERTLNAIAAIWTLEQQKMLFKSNSLDGETKCSHEMKYFEQKLRHGFHQLSEKCETNMDLIVNLNMFLQNSKQLQMKLVNAITTKENYETEFINITKENSEILKLLKDELENCFIHKSAINFEVTNKTLEVEKLKLALEQKTNYARTLELRKENCRPRRQRLDGRNRRRRNSIAEAMKNGDLGKVEELLAKGSDPNTKDGHGWTVLHRASEIGNLDIIKILVKHGANLTAEIDNHSGDLPIHTAAVKNHAGVVEWMLEYGIPVDIRNKIGTTPMLAGVWNNRHSLVRSLVDKGAMVNARIYNLDNRTALHLTAKYGYAEEAQYLIDQGAELEARTGEHCDRPVSFLDVTSKDCETPLHWAARNKHLNVAIVLINNGADIYSTNAAGRNAYEIAKDNRRYEVIKGLEKYYFNTSTDYDGSTTPVVLETTTYPEYDDTDTEASPEENKTQVMFETTNNVDDYDEWNATVVTLGNPEEPNSNYTII